jgi:hypothetical protein
MQTFPLRPQIFVLEELEQRAHLAATLLSAYWPLTQGSTWQFLDVDDGKSSTSTETILSGTEAANGERALRRASDDEDGRDISLENYSRDGRLQFHGVRADEGGMKFHPAVAYPKFATPGAHVTDEGTIDMRYRSVPLKGTYHFEIRVLKREQVKVAAGTFSTIKVQMIQEFVVENHRNGHDIVLKFSGTDTQWLAKGVGRVKSVGDSHIRITADGKSDRDDGVDKSALQSYSIAPRV